MKLAIEEARKGLGFVAPNPPVGCVILNSNGDLIAKGYHKIFGGDHAEIDALKQIKNPDDLKGATLYVTLEPCAHEGKTPSCAKKLAQLPIQKVVYGLVDPNVQVSGKGLEILKNADIQIEQMPQLRNEIEVLTEIFLWNHRQKKTFVALKVATSLDGQMAHINGESRWITGEESRRYVHELRAAYDAVLVGKNTFLMDNPYLNIRHERYPQKKNKVIIVDSRGEVLNKLKSSHLTKVHAPEDINVAVSKSEKVKSDCAQIIFCDDDGSGNVSLGDLFDQIYKLGIGSVLVEGGARIHSSILNQNLAQRIYQFIAPQIIGAKAGINYTQEFAISSLANKIELHQIETQSLGKDIFVTARLSAI